MIEVEVPEGIPLKPLKKKIDELVKEEEARWVLFERAKEEVKRRRRTPLQVTGYSNKIKKTQRTNGG
jgi:hypothetical protein